MRGQATPIQHEHQKGTPKSTQTMIMLQGQGFLPTSRPSSISGRLDHPWLHWGWARTSRMIIDHSKHLEASRHIFSSQCNQNRHQALKPMQTLFLQGYSSRTFRHSNEAKLRKAKGRRRSSGVPVLTKNGGAERDRTADPLLAKQVLSQLSYSPNRSDHLPDPRMVGPGRLELPTSRLSGVRSNHLSYGPIPVARTT